MGDFYTHSRNIDLITRTVEQRLALFPPPQRLLSSARDFFRSKPARKSETVVDGLKFADGEIRASSSGIFRDSPKRLMRVFLHAQQRGLKLHPDLAQLIRNELSLVDNAFLRDPHVRETFLEILDQRGNVAPVLRMMHEVGFLGKFLPEFGRLTCLVQHEFYHQYTADEHTLVCIEKLDQFWNAKTPPFSRLRGNFSRASKTPFILYLALLLHDSGQGLSHRPSRGNRRQGGLKRLAPPRLGRRQNAHPAPGHREPSGHGANFAAPRPGRSRRSSTRWPAGFRPWKIWSCSPSTPSPIRWAPAINCGTGSKTPCCGGCIEKTRHVLTGGTEFLLAEARQRELLVEEVQRLAPHTFDPAEIQAHFNNVPARYLQINDAREILRDVTHVHRFIQLQLSESEDNALAPVISWHNEPDRGYTVVIVCTWDRERSLQPHHRLPDRGGLQHFERRNPDPSRRRHSGHVLRDGRPDRPFGQSRGTGECLRTSRRKS